MSVRYRGRIPYVDPENPQSWARDDYTGLPIMAPDRIKQMEYFGTGLAWTGFMVHYKDADQPNPQRMPPRLKPDPVPISNPRYLTLQELPLVPDAATTVKNTGSLITGVTIDAFTSTSITISWIPIQSAKSYVVSWFSTYSRGEAVNLKPTTYTIPNLSPGSSYYVQVASNGDPEEIKSSIDAKALSAFSVPVYQTLPSTT